MSATQNQRLEKMDVIFIVAVGFLCKDGRRGP